MKVRQYTWSRACPNIVQFNSLHCFDCSPGTKCPHFHLGQMNFEERKSENPKTLKGNSTQDKAKRKDSRRRPGKSTNFKRTSDMMEADHATSSQTLRRSSR